MKYKNLKDRWEKLFTITPEILQKYDNDPAEVEKVFHLFYDPVTINKLKWAMIRNGMASLPNGERSPAQEQLHFEIMWAHIRKGMRAESISIESIRRIMPKKVANYWRDQQCAGELDTHYGEEWEEDKQAFDAYQSLGNADFEQLIGEISEMLDGYIPNLTCIERKYLLAAFECGTAALRQDGSWNIKNIKKVLSSQEEAIPSTQAISKLLNRGFEKLVNFMQSEAETWLRDWCFSLMQKLQMHRLGYSETCLPEEGKQRRIKIPINPDDIDDADSRKNWNTIVHGSYLSCLSDSHLNEQDRTEICDELLNE
jgi:hypothetical protein